MKKILCAGTAGLALFAGIPAHSADLGVAPIYKQTPAVAVATWTGSYLGISGGGKWGRGVIHNGLSGLDETPRFDLNGGIVGITSGFNYQAGSWVLGYEGDTSLLSNRGRAFEIPPFDPTFSNQLKEQWLSTYRGRVGYAQDSWLLYATGGAASARIEQNIFGTGGTPVISQRRWNLGWAAGGGIEMKFAPNWSAKAEYLFVDFHDKSYFSPSPNPLFVSDQRPRLDEHIFRVGVNYKLPWGIIDLLGGTR